MSSNSALESRRVRDPRFQLKTIIDAQLKAQADQVQPDDLLFNEQAVSAYSLQRFFDTGLDIVFNGNVNNIFYTPFEPDYQYLTVHLLMDNTGNQALDYSGFRNHGDIGANPDLVDKINIGQGWGTMPSLNFNGLSDYIDINSSTSINTATYNTSLGFTIFAYIRPEDISNDGFGFRRTISAKTDNDDYAHMFCIDGNGDLLFHVLNNGVEYKVKASTSIFPTAVHQVIARFDAAASSNKATVFVNGVKHTTPSTTIIQPYPTPPGTPGSATNPSSADSALHIGRADNILQATSGAFDPNAYDPNAYDVVKSNPSNLKFARGTFAGQMCDYRLYMRPFTDAEAANIWANRQTIYDIPMGQVGLFGFSVFNP
jgi:hypothetical protein